MRRRSGHSLVELMLSVMLLGTLLTLLFVIFHQGWVAWRMAGTRSDLSNQSRLVVQSLVREMESSVYDSLSIDGEAVSFLSARDDAGNFLVDPNGDPSWQRYVIFYREASTDQVLRCQFPVGPISTPVPIEQHTGNPLTSYLSPDRVVARSVKRLALTVPPDSRRIRLEVEVELPQRNGQPPARKSVVSSVFFRND